MTNKEFFEIWVPATGTINKGKSIGTSEYMDLEEMLGVKEFTEWLDRVGQPDPELPPKLKSLLLALAGPHSATVLRAYKAKHNIKEKVDD